MKHVMQVGLGTGQIVLDGDSALLPQMSIAHQFSPHICFGQMAAWIKMPLGTEVDLSLGDIVLYEDPAPLPPKAHNPQFSANVRCG